MPSDPSPDLIDTALLAKVSGSSPQLVLEVLGDFAAGFPAGLASLAQQLAARDYPAATDHLHRQKGAAGSLGLAALHAALAAMEASCEGADPPGPEELTPIRSLAADSIDQARAFLASLS